MRAQSAHNRWILGSILVAALAASASAVNITFEEYPATNYSTVYLAQEYAYLGIHFTTTDDGSIWSGLSGGDPGNWGIDGTNGPQFLGFNGDSYALTTTFDAPISGFQLDVSRSNGSSAGNTFTLQGYLGGNPVDSVTVTLDDLNVWKTAALTQAVDSIVWSGSGQGFHPFGVDNASWVPEPGSLSLLALAGLLGRRRR